MWPVRESFAKSIISPVSGFLKEAGFTHSLTPARNCTYGCTYCYVPTMRFYGGLKPEDWKHWGQFTTIKSNAAELVEKTIRGCQIIYCSPLVDPYQPTEEQTRLMPGLLRAALCNPPKVFVIQTRGPLILRDLPILADLGAVTRLRISFSVTTNREDVRRRYEPHCESNDRRLETINRLRVAGLEVYATLAPILPCDAEHLVSQAIQASRRDLIADPLHVRATKSRGATTRASALEIAERFGETQWFDPNFQSEMLLSMTRQAETCGFTLLAGTKGFGLLARTGLDSIGDPGVR